MLTDSLNVRNSLGWGLRKPGIIIPRIAADAEISRFWMNVEDNSPNINLAADEEGVIDHGAGTITVWYPMGSDLSEVIFRWEVPSHYGVPYIITVGGVLRYNGQSKFNFGTTNPQTFIVGQKPGTTNFKEYVVTMVN